LQGTQKAASQPMSHERHDDNQAGDGARQTDPPSLSDGRTGDGATPHR
jgi:hypothetical protein